MSLSDINALREYIQNELSKVAVFMKATNGSIGNMQDTDSLLLDKFKKLASALEDITEQLGLQQRQINELVSIIHQIVRPEYLRKLDERRSQSEPEPSTEQSNTMRCPPSNDEPGTHDAERHDLDNDEDVDSDK